MKHIGKLFNRYDVNFPVDESLTIVIGSNGSGKTKTLELVTEYFTKKGENVLYFPSDRYLSIDQDQIDSVLTMHKLIDNNVFERFGINHVNLNHYEKGYITSGHVQIMNMLCPIMLNPDREYVVIIDEPERNLHLTNKRKIVDVIYDLKNVKKLILSTHSPEVVGSYRNETRDMKEIVNLYDIQIRRVKKCQI
jgi:predicted ATP-binding protein involved in virulence